MKRSTKTSRALLASTGLLVAGGATGAVAAKLITGDRIATATITARNLAPNSVGKSEIKPGVVTDGEDGADGAPGAQAPAGPQGEQGERGATGPQGPQGATGPEGPRGLPGEAGPVVVEAWTEVTDYDELWRARVTGVDANQGGADLEVTVLRFELDPGTYLIDTTTQFFRGDGEGEDYGVATLYVDGVNVPGTVFTGDLPGSNTTAAQAGGTQLVTIFDEGTEVEVRASVRGSEFALVGAQSVVTQLSEGFAA